MNLDTRRNNSVLSVVISMSFPVGKIPADQIDELSHLPVICTNRLVSVGRPTVC